MAAVLAKAGAPWQAVIVVALLPIAPHLERVISLCMTLQVVDRLRKQRYTGSFKGPCDVELTGPTEPLSPEPEPLKPKRWLRWLRRKPPPDD
jgi:hypothetical protein